MPFSRGGSQLLENKQQFTTKDANRVLAFKQAILWEMSV